MSETCNVCGATMKASACDQCARNQFITRISTPTPLTVEEARTDIENRIETWNYLRDRERQRVLPMSASLDLLITAAKREGRREALAEVRQLVTTRRDVREGALVTGQNRVLRGQVQVLGELLAALDAMDKH